MNTLLSTKKMNITGDVRQTLKKRKKILNKCVATPLENCQYLCRRVTKLVYNKKIVKTAAVFPSSAVVVVINGGSQTLIQQCSVNFDVFFEKSKSSKSITIVAPNEFLKQRLVLVAIAAQQPEAVFQKVRPKTLENIARGKNRTVEGHQQ